MILTVLHWFSSVIIPVLFISGILWYKQWSVFKFALHPGNQWGSWSPQKHNERRQSDWETPKQCVIDPWSPATVKTLILKFRVTWKERSFNFADIYRVKNFCILLLTLTNCLIKVDSFLVTFAIWILRELDKEEENLIFFVLEICILFFKPIAEGNITCSMQHVKLCTLKAHSALWEYFESNTFLKENYSLTITVSMISWRPRMNLWNLC